MTPEQLKEIRDRWGKATPPQYPGPWTAHRQQGGQIAGWPAVWIEFGRGIGIEIDNTDRAYLDGARHPVAVSIAQAIAAAPTDIAALLAEVERLQKEVNRDA